MLSDILLIPFAIAYFIVITLLYIYGLNFYYLTLVALIAQKHTPEQLLPPTTWPKVTIQLPIYNEMYVAHRLISAAAAVDYPPDCLEIQVLDDSTDETTEIVAATILQLAQDGMDIQHIRRPDRDGFKAGALRDGLALATGEFIAIFDADFLPSPDFLHQTLPPFRDPKIAFVQARWDHINRDYSLLTFIQSLAIDAHFMVEQLSRSHGQYFFNFNGTAGVWRRAAIVDAGGWQAHTLTEDLDLSYRAFLKGWRAAYLPHVTVSAELPALFSAFRRQQHRWARGSLENAVNLLPEVWQSSFPLRTKMEATLHLTGYGVHLLLFALCLIYPLAAIISIRFPAVVSLFGIALLFNATAFAPTIYFLVAQHHLKRPWWKLIPLMLFITAFGSGLMLNTVRATLEAIFGRPRIFERTPKHGLAHKSERWRTKKYQLSLDNIVFWELGLGILNLVSVVLAWRVGHWFIAFYALLFAIGFFFTSFYTLGQSLHAAPES